MIWTHMPKQNKRRSKSAVRTQNRHHSKRTGIDSIFDFTQQPREQDKVCPQTDHRKTLTKENP